MPISNKGVKMRHHIFQFAWILALGAGVAIAQNSAQQQDRPSTTRPVVSSDTPQQNPDQTPQAPANPDRSTQTPVSPDEDKPPSSQTSTMTRGTASSQAQSQVQEALQRQMPSGAGNVTVSVAADNSIQLTGTVSSDDQKKQAEQIAHAAAPDQTIINNLSVSGTSSGSSSRAGSSAATTPSATGETNESGQSAKLPQSDMGQMGTADIQSKIQAGIKTEPMLSDSSITVDTTDKSIDLSGTVTSKAAEDKALEIARANAGGRKVVDHLRVTTKPF
jgi:osmotically-inducible protein OsmY